MLNGSEAANVNALAKVNQCIKKEVRARSQIPNFLGWTYFCSILFLLMWQ
jgi:hypothetical protein